MRRAALCVWTLLAAAALVSADTVVLTNGNAFEGELREVSDRQVVIEVKGGLLTFPRRLVKSVTRSPQPGPSSTEAPADAGASIDWGSGTNHWREHHPDLAVGEVWTFRKQRADQLPGHEPHGSTEVRESWRVERLGLDGIELGRRRFLADPASYPDPGVEPSVWTEAAPSPRSLHDVDLSQVDPLLARELPRATAASLELAGRTFPCKRLELRQNRARIQIWVHHDRGRVRWPGVLKTQRDDRVTWELVAIEPAEGAQAAPPEDPGVRVGDVLTYERGGRVVRRTVTRMCPSEVELEEQGEGSPPQLERWVWGRDRPRGTRGAASRLTLGARRLQVAEWTHEGRFERYAVSPDGQIVFPGLVASGRLTPEARTTFELKDWRSR